MVGDVQCGAVMLLAAIQVFAGVPQAAYAQDQMRFRTRTPIKHVIVIIGENRTFDHIFATYKPKQGETVDNLLSRRRSSTRMERRAANFSLAHQDSAVAR